jgi:hypothetical protein
MWEPHPYGRSVDLQKRRDHRMKCTSMILVLIGTFCVVRDSAGQVTTKPPEKFLGSWKQVPRSDDPSGLRVEPESGSIKLSFGCRPDGSCQDIITANYDGKPYKDPGSPTWEASFRKTADGTMQEDRYSSGKLSSTVAWQLSTEGKTLTRTIHFIDPPSSKVATQVYERDGGPVSKDDAFTGFWKRDSNKSDPVVLKFTSKGSGLTFTDPRGVEHERNCDGNDHPDPDSTFEQDALYSCRFTDDRTYEATSKRNGTVLTVTRRVSEDGKKMVATTRNAAGKTTSEYTYEKMN